MRSALLSVVDDIVNQLLHLNKLNRKNIEISEIIKKLQDILHSSFGANSFISGSYLSRVILPGEAIEIVQFLPSKLCMTWRSKIIEV
jgi:hypothetical protein